MRCLPVFDITRTQIAIHNVETWPSVVTVQGPLRVRAALLSYANVLVPLESSFKMLQAHKILGYGLRA